ncbi:hypothetical protein HMPREF2534_04246 [Bacteroides thetaiotaomicron]|nr:hypothetical protein HMPREF2534_04246 [Bacteroides thetaiotaomicron]
MILCISLSIFTHLSKDRNSKNRKIRKLCFLFCYLSIILFSV